jgi:hypothetical protein
LLFSSPNPGANSAAVVAAAGGERGSGDA